jgi:hypothetical protein
MARRATHAKVKHGTRKRPLRHKARKGSANAHQKKLRKYYVKNRRKILTKARKYYRSHKAKILKVARKYRRITRKKGHHRTTYAAMGRIGGKIHRFKRMKRMFKYTRHGGHKGKKRTKSTRTRKHRNRVVKHPTGWMR